MDLSRLIGLLFEKVDDPFAAKALSWLIRPPPLPYSELFALCQSAGRTQAVARTVAATVAVHPEGAHEWLTLLREPFLDELPPPKMGWGAYTSGVVLGMFQAGLWLDQNGMPQVPYHGTLIATTRAVVMCELLPLQYTADCEFREQLAGTVQPYVREEHSDALRYEGKLLRAAGWADVLIAIAGDILRRDAGRPDRTPGSVPNEIGEVLLNQVTGALFGMASPHDRIAAVSAFLLRL